MTRARNITAKKWGLMGTLAATGLATALSPSSAPFPDRPSSLFVSAAHASEGGEAGEGAVHAADADIEFLVHLGFFDATHRIVAELYAQGETALAQEHLEASHHAAYEDIAEGLMAPGARGFKDLSDRFAAAVLSNAPQDEVAERAASVITAIDAAHKDIGMDLEDEFKAMHLLMQTAANDFRAGVEEGKVVLAQEYRDAWGFAKAVQARAASIAASNEPETAQTPKDSAPVETGQRPKRL